MITCQNYLYDGNVMESVLKFLVEFVYCRNSRIKFDNGSIYSIVLFKNLSKVINGYGKVIIDNVGDEEFFKKFNGKIKRLLGIMAYILNGGYIPFGVFEIYEDTCFVDSLRTSFEVLAAIPTNEITVIF